MDFAANCVVIAVGLFAGALLGRILIPYFRKLKTGKFEPVIGDRSKQDGSEPKLGGAVIFAPFILAITAATAFFTARNDIGADLRLIFTSAASAGIMCALGAYEDILSDRGANVGMKPVYKIACRFVVIIAALAVLRLFGRTRTGWLLPFHLGYLELGYLYYPLTALLGTLFISAVCICDCPGGRTKLGIDGLCPAVMMLFFMGITTGLTSTGLHPEAQVLAAASMAAAGGFLFWGLCPSKLYLGESGALTLGTLAVMCAVCADAELILLIGGGVVLIDGISALLQFIVFKTTKNLLMKGYTLHEHLKIKGLGAYTIIGLFSAVSVLFSALIIWYLIYTAKFLP